MKKNEKDEKLPHRQDDEGSADSDGKKGHSGLEIPEDQLPELTDEHRRQFKEAKRNIKNAPLDMALLGLALALMRLLGLWRLFKRPVYKSFKAYYTDLGYSSDQVCNLIASAALLKMLADEFVPEGVKVTPYHATILLTATRNEKARYEADVTLARDIYRDVVAQCEQNKERVTGKKIRELLIARGLMKAPKSQLATDSGEPDFMAEEVARVEVEQSDQPRSAEAAENVPLRWLRDLEDACDLAAELAHETSGEVQERILELQKLIEKAIEAGAA